MRHHLTAVIALALTVPCARAEEDPATFGTLNPDEMTWQKNVERAGRGEVDMMVCASGYLMTKAGDHASARAVFEACAARGYTGAMTWMSQLDNNGLGAEYDPDAAADWDRRAAEAGDPVGQFNHGLNLMRGHGVPKDEALGRQYVDTAAAEGLDIAQRLQSSGYDLDEVTPDADNWKYAPVF
ncbi:sel1 repeat family protein [Pseudooceanicola onchidii]|uniref:sel1 repeat family protein n=1 Tax=Pseudooceanicola onchidii TaxID=2562279 RepID=UPI0010AAF77B|nr:sel1 repeat family protein [Pseudooceanicola onchidii]